MPWFDCWDFGVCERCYRQADEHGVIEEHELLTGYDAEDSSLYAASQQ